ncbi:Ig-like domain-containing protein [Fulvivirga ligni]|uniref:Ig-like domain-containing protein n=1 Tax=Fulvivirga ligni TaxID=2904246 RepID=UPI001F491456|nr:Ig-like domain-containing protein [Fulvivirga ligni]UII23415.1 Ig-like domain-containing protein [Fulvivirga ligni]
MKLNIKIYQLLLACMVFTSCVACKDENSDDLNKYVTSVQLIGNDIKNGTSSQVSAIILPEEADDRSVTWSSSDEAIATVDQNGLVTATANGTVTITATANDRGSVKGTVQITISSFEEEQEATVVVNTLAALITAVENAEAGDVIEVAAGTYAFTSRLDIEVSGSESKMIVLRAAADGGRPKFDFSAMSESSSNQGVILNADYWHIKGIDFYKAGDNGLKIQGSNNIIEFCTFSECSDSGLQIDSGGANNTILNCDSYFNADSSIENADGFACKLTAGTGNKFIGCRAWQNLDDGWDGYLRGADNITTTYENCWAIKNGYLKNGTQGGGDGNGFKTGGSDDKQLKHNAVYHHCLAVGNTADGFDHNSNRGTVTLFNCSAYDNGNNLNFSNTNPLEKLIIKNSAVLGTVGSLNATSKEISSNAWDLGITVSEEDFESIDIDLLLAPRKADGSLPDVDFMRLKSDSDMIDKGVDVGLSFNGAAPDLGAFESDN